MPRQWLTPDALPAGVRCVQITVPDDEDFYAMLIGAITPLLFPENYEQHGSLTPEDCAAWWIEWDDSQTWEDCP